MSFEKANAIICENCGQLIPEEWKADYELNWCPKCNNGYSEDKVKQWKKENDYNDNKAGVNESN